MTSTDPASAPARADSPAPADTPAPADNQDPAEIPADTDIAARFASRHIGPRGAEIDAMLAAVAHGGLDELVDAAVPPAIRDADPLAELSALPAARPEQEVLQALRDLAGRNGERVQMIGQGYYDTVTPPVLRRNLLESPAWYTAYTPYQPEISQGRLEALLTFQTMVADLTALPVAGASLLDEATAVVEAVLLMRRAVRGKDRTTVVVDAECMPQSVAVLRGRADAVGMDVVVADLTGGLPAAQDLPSEPFGVVLQYPGVSGAVRDLAPVIAEAKDRGAMTTVAADLLALTLLTPPGEQGADIAVGSAQRFGVPLFFGGPHAGYISTRTGLERKLPGRLVGVSVDRDGRPAYRLALQTREQHIRRDKATSNICTAQALLANVAAMYAAYHGPDGLAAIAQRVHSHAQALAVGLRAGGIEVLHDAFFDTVAARVPGRAAQVVAAAEADGINLRPADPDTVTVSCDELTTGAVVARVLAAFGAAPAERGRPAGRAEPSAAGAGSGSGLPANLRRASEYLTHPVFHEHRSETAMMRFLRELSDKDLALDRTMIPLGSCTMKLNAAAEMEPISYPGFASIHPYAPATQTAGYRELIGDLERWLCAITGYDRVSLQPNAGSQGELAGLKAIRSYHLARGDGQRDVCLVPDSAHGTNAASAVLAGLRVAVVASAPDGSIDVDALRSTLAEHEGRVAAIMITYPSTSGIYDADVTQVCELVHAAGGQVYLDGANLNALVGLARPGRFGGDVSHLNLHKTFCIPHGGGGPGVGPVAVREHLAQFLPGDPAVDDGSGGSGGSGGAGAGDGAGKDGWIGPDGGSAGAPVAAAAFGSAGILPITWAYLALMGPEGLADATKTAVLSANYLARRLQEHYPVLYTGRGGLVAHECILDIRGIKKNTGVTAEDIAKRLMDYGFHAPTMSFPVMGTLMVEPTESENLAELDRFVEAMIAIRGEIDRVAAGEWPLEDSPLRQAPHTAEMVTADAWELPYPRSLAAFPVPSLHARKYWPPVRRIDQAHGDRNLVCSCPPPEAFDVAMQEVSS